jgi:hypothetical protein
MEKGSASKQDPFSENYIIPPLTTTGDFVFCIVAK